MTADYEFESISGLYGRLGRGGHYGQDNQGETGPGPGHSFSVGPRVVVVLLDVSNSMAFPVAGRRRIDVLNERLQEWLPLIREAGRGKLRQAEIAVVTFGGRGVRPVTGRSSGPASSWPGDGGVFVSLVDLDVGELVAYGGSPLAEAIETALGLAEARVRHLAGQHVQAGPARVLMLADGGSYDARLSTDVWEPAAARVAALRARDEVQFFAFGVPGASEPVLQAIAGEGYAPLLESGFGNLLDLILRATAAEHPLDAVRKRFGWGPADDPAQEPR